VPALAAAGILIGVAIYLTNEGSTGVPPVHTSETLVPQQPSPVVEPTPDPALKGPEDDDLIVSPRQPEETDAIPPSHVPAPKPRVEPSTVQPRPTPPEPSVAVDKPAPELRILEKEVAAKAMPQHELGSGGDRVHASATPGEINLATDIWRPTGDLVIERQPLSAGIPLKSDDQDVWKRGGLIYLVPQSLSRGRPSLKLEVTGPVFSSPLHDFEFIVTNKPHAGTLITLSVKRENLDEIQKVLDLKRPTHTFELIVWRFNRYEILVDGHTFYFHCETLNQPEWDNLYLGFRGLSRNTTPDTQLLVRQVSVGYVDKETRK
jgi:hypothetical protein